MRIARRVAMKEERVLHSPNELIVRLETVRDPSTVSRVVATDGMVHAALVTISAEVQ